MPLHIWLPGAHANAPSHVSALMSGVLIKMGIYGLVRVTSLFPAPPAWWGTTLLVLGGASGVLGVAYAIAQHDIKRLLAYHSVENIGIILMGLGLAVLGRSSHRPELILLGIAAALFHTWNHGLFKALLFLSAGSLIHATGTRSIDRLGGLARAMPRTALAFLVGAVAICGLPPLNGFVSEYLLYVGFLQTVAGAGDDTWLAGAFGAPALALIGALAVACFAKVFGAVFLGVPRSPAPRGAARVGARDHRLDGRARRCVCDARLRAACRRAAFRSRGGGVGARERAAPRAARGHDVARLDRRICGAARRHDRGPRGDPSRAGAHGTREHRAHVGLRVRRPVGTHAIHRFILRRHDRRLLWARAASRAAHPGAARSFPARERLRVARRRRRS